MRNRSGIARAFAFTFSALLLIQSLIAPAALATEIGQGFASEPSGTASDEPDPSADEGNQTDPSTTGDPATPESPESPDPSTSSDPMTSDPSSPAGPESDGAATPSAESDAASNPAEPVEIPDLTVQAHVSDLGWLAAVGSGVPAGDLSAGRSLEAIKVSVGDEKAKLRAHVSEIGWGEWSSDGQAGTTGRALSIQALQMKLPEDLSGRFDLWYRVCATGHGWLGWAKNGDSAGTQGYACPAQALEVRIVAKGAPAPGATDDAFLAPLITYRAHVSNIGWQTSRADGETAGTTGRSLELEALSVSLGPSAGSGGVEISAHVTDIGWQAWTSGSGGTTGQVKAVQALRIRLTGAAAGRYDVWYRVHSSDFGWLGWARNGSPAGSQGYNKQAEAFEMKLTAKDKDAPGPETGAFKAPSLIWRAHSADIGWRGGSLASSSPSVVLGVTGKAKKLQAFTLNAPGLGLDGSVAYSAHVTDIGWQHEVSDGATAGTTGQNRAVQAVKIALKGGLAERFDVWYRVHVSEIGWLGWTSNGKPAGSESLNGMAEAVEVAFLPKGSAAPGDASNPFLSRPDFSVQAYVQGSGWTDPVGWGGTAGSVGHALSLQALRLSVSSPLSGSISVGAHVSNIGWMAPVGSGQDAGTPGSNDLEAMYTKLTGNLSRFYDIWYRVHTRNYGWLGWTKNGSYAGTSKLCLPAEAVQFTITAKGAPAPGSTAWPYFETFRYIGWQNPGNYPQVSNTTVRLPSYCTGEFTYVSPSRIPYNATREDCVNAFINRANEYLGTQYIEPYSTAPGGAVDCSGLVLQCLYATGMDLGWYNPYNHRWLPEQTYNSTNWYRNNTFMPVGISQIKRGDLLYYRGHVAIYLGGNLMIDSWPHQGVTIQNIHSRGAIIGAARPYVG